MRSETVTTVAEVDFAIENFRVADEDLPDFVDMKFENINELHLDHPGANDEEYRAARLHRVARKEVSGNRRDNRCRLHPREQRVWRYVAEELEELHQRHASPFYLRAKKDLGITTDRIPQLSEMNRRLKELTGFRLAPIEGLVETRAFCHGFHIA